MKTKLKRKFKPRIKTKGKSYGLSDSGLYNLSTKKKLEERLHQTVGELEKVATDSNYRIFYLNKPDGGKREIQAPTLALDIVQTRIASLLVRVAMPEYLHSGVKGRSNITNARVHVGSHPVLTMDIRKFYPSVKKSSIYHFFYKTMNSPPDVAGILAELCSFDDHIPTGSRLSMPLSYWANHSMFNRLNALCEGQKVAMSIYVDDLTFSGPSVNRLFKKNVRQIVQDAGLEIHPDKTRLYGSNEPKLITGVMITEDGIKLRHKHHQAIYTLFNDLEEVDSDEQLEVLQKKLIGRLNAAGQIEQPFKHRARTLNNSFKVLKSL